MSPYTHNSSDPFNKDLSIDARIRVALIKAELPDAKEQFDAV